MDDEMKNQVIEKIEAMINFIGYTKYYSDVDIDDYYSEVKILI